MPTQIRLMPVTVNPEKADAFYIGPGGVDWINHPWWHVPLDTTANRLTLRPDGTVLQEWVPTHE